MILIKFCFILEEKNSIGIKESHFSTETFHFGREKIHIGKDDIHFGTEKFRFGKGNSYLVHKYFILIGNILYKYHRDSPSEKV